MKLVAIAVLFACAALANATGGTREQIDKYYQIRRNTQIGLGIMVEKVCKGGQVLAKHLDTCEEFFGADYVEQALTCIFKLKKEVEDAMDKCENITRSRSVDDSGEASA